MLREDQSFGEGMTSWLCRSGRSPWGFDGLDET